MIRHASPPAALAVLSLAVPVIEPPFRTLLVAAVGAAPLTKSGLLAAGDAAIALSAITAGAEEERGAAVGVQAKPLP